MIEVHHLNNSRSQRVLWLLEELGVDYQIVRYERDAKTMLAPASLKTIHPLGKSPVVRDNAAVLAESGAIIEHLIEHHGNGRFAPPRNAPAYENYRYWLHYAEGSLMPPFLINLYLGRVGEAASPMQERARAMITQHLDFVESSLASRSYLVGDALTAADIQMSFPVELAATQGFLTDAHQGLRNWLSRLHERPAYQRALEKGGPYAFAK
jgi:glutathione S-transferase